jgi:acetyl esterase/lipase
VTAVDEYEPLPPVPYDPELEPALAGFLDLVEGIPLRAHTIQVNREHFATIVPPLEQLLEGRAIRAEHRRVPGPASDPDVEITILHPESAVPGAAGIYLIHGGGMMLGNRFFGLDEVFDLVERDGVVAVAVDYRLAPEYPDPAPVEDCYAGLVWMAANAAELGIDPGRILVSGASAGAGLSAGIALLARDRGGPALAGQLLNAPMIDDRNDSVSSRQYDGIGAWDRNNNDTGWNALLGDRRFTASVSPYAAPARATDLSGLPPAFIEVGAAEVFRTEAVDYASRIWAAGGRAELHVWAGAFHGFAGFAAGTRVGAAANAVRSGWIRRVLEL